MAKPLPIHRFSPKTRDSCFVEVQRLDSGHVLTRMGPHAHTFFEVILIVRGTGRHRVGGEFHVAAPGDVFVLSPGEAHDCAEMGNVEGWVLMFTPEAINGSSVWEQIAGSGLPVHPLCLPFMNSARHIHRPLSLDAVGLNRWSERMEALSLELHSTREGYLYVVNAYLMLILVDLLRLIRPHLTIEDTAADPLLGAVFAYIDKNYHRPISVADLAKVVQRSAAHLTTVLKQRTGLSASQWIAERRMTEVRRLLIQSSQPLAVIAQKVGYEEAEALIRVFRRLHGVTPAVWRRAHLENPAYSQST
jgi:AraC family transcriptional regulator, transcriptional activator of pobA